MIQVDCMHSRAAEAAAAAAVFHTKDFIRPKFAVCQSNSFIYVSISSTKPSQVVNYMVSVCACETILILNYNLLPREQFPHISAI